MRRVREATFLTQFGKRMPSGNEIATIDAKQSSHSIKEMAGHRIYLVGPASIIQNTPRYQSAGNVISFRTFLDNYLDPAMRRWRQAGIIS